MHYIIPIVCCKILPTRHKPEQCVFSSYIWSMWSITALVHVHVHTRICLPWRHRAVIFDVFSENRLQLRLSVYALQAVAWLENIALLVYTVRVAMTDVLALCKATVGIHCIQNLCSAPWRPPWFPEEESHVASEITLRKCNVQEESYNCLFHTLHRLTSPCA